MSTDNQEEEGKTFTHEEVFNAAVNQLMYFVINPNTYAPPEANRLTAIGVVLSDIAVSLRKIAGRDYPDPRDDQ